MEGYRKHFSELSADAQKFPRALHKVHGYDLTGVSNDEILSMAV